MGVIVLPVVNEDRNQYSLTVMARTGDTKVVVRFNADRSFKGGETLVSSWTDGETRSDVCRH